MSALRQLLNDRREIDPDILALDVAVLGEFDDMQQPEFEQPVLAGKSERATRRSAPPHRLIDQEVVAVETVQAFHVAVGQVGKEGLVEGPRAVAAMRRS